MLPGSLAAWIFALGGALAVGFLAWLMYWQYRILFDPEIRALFRAGKRPPGFLARGSWSELISKPPAVLVFLALITSVPWTAGVLLILFHVIHSQRFWLEVGQWGLALLGGVVVFSWAMWSLLSRPEDRVRLTQTASQGISAGIDSLAEKPSVALPLYVIAISFGLLMIADSVVSGQLIGLAQPAERSDLLDFLGQIAIWLGWTGWVGGSFLLALRKHSRKREVG